MKTAILCFCLLVSSVIAGEQRIKNTEGIAQRKAQDAFEAGTNYYSLEQFLADVEASKNFAELKTVIAKKAKSDKDNPSNKKNKK